MKNHSLFEEEQKNIIESRQKNVEDIYKEKKYLF